MTHDYVEYFEKPSENESEAYYNPEQRIIATGIGSFNKDNKYHSDKERYDAYVKQVGKVSEMQQQMAEEVAANSTFCEYEGD